MWFGITLLLVGVVLLLQNLGLLPADSWDVIWPVLFIVLGASIIFRRAKKG
ncbi:MAG: DUF5668 domain-containing protein [Patescibacteria group bacterium]|jgi:uncharacterized membrane protein HdeD (DUF308 family)